MELEVDTVKETQTISEILKLLSVLTDDGRLRVVQVVCRYFADVSTSKAEWCKAEAHRLEAEAKAQTPEIVDSEEGKS